MKGQQNLSPKKYIETRARTLPVHKCWVNGDWQSAGIANVVVSRRHVNGNLTTGIYLVDLLCLGVKDTFYFFNEPEEDLMERLNIKSGFFKGLDYNLAHNIIYAGHDFAEEYDIHPHKEFALTKFILDEDTDDVPLVEVPVGDEEGKPSLIVSSDYNYRPALEKLKKNAGEGNYTFILNDDDFEEDDDSEDEEEDDWDEEFTLDEIEPDYLDFPDVADVSDEELEEAAEGDLRSEADKRIIYVEQLLRLKEESDAGWIWFEDDVRGTDDFALFTEKIPGHQQAFADSEDRMEVLTQQVNELAEEENAGGYVDLFESYAQNELEAFAVLNSMPMLTTALRLPYLQENLTRYAPLAQLGIAAYSLALQQGAVSEKFHHLTGAPTVEEIFPADTPLHAMHQKLFWVVKSLHAMNTDDITQIQRFHSLLKVTGIGGGLRHAYAIRFSQWLEAN